MVAAPIVIRLRSRIAGPLCLGLVLLGCEGAIEGSPTPPVIVQEPADKPETPDAGPRVPPDSDPEPVAADDCTGVIDVASAPLRRLTRTEYQRTVADVFGVEEDVSGGLSADERIDGMFASNASSSVALVQVRQYLDAAEGIAAKVDLAKLDSCDPASMGAEACAQQLIERVGRRAYRRALSPEERAAYLTLYRGVAAGESHALGLRWIVQTMLQAPDLLYHLELREGGDNQSQPARLPGYALAARLSYFMWSSAPDDTLLSAAESGELATDAGLLKQAERMFADPRARASLGSFHDQWLGLQKLDVASRDPQLFPEWSPQLAAATRSEVARFADYVIRDQKADLATLLTASFSFPEGPALALRAATNTPAADGKLELTATRSAGLLTQPAFLAAHSHSDQTSPIIRGRALRERFFCQPLPDPPADVAAVAPALSAGLTTRERYALHRTSGSSCQGCHSLIDDLGFALEQFDAIGRFRESEQGKPIDARGMLTQTDSDGPIDGARALAERMAQSSDVSDCYAKLWFRYALGRVEASADRCALARIEATFARDPSIRGLLLAITTSEAFTRARAP